MARAPMGAIPFEQIQSASLAKADRLLANGFRLADASARSSRSAAFMANAASR